jgi:transcriptional regulator GlxA family with amidase domain
MEDRNMVSNDRRVQRVVHSIKHDLSRRPTLAEAGAIACLSPAHFSRCFYRTMGVGFAEWNACIRVEQAKDLLRFIDLSVTAIAASVGYLDATTFARVFRRVERMSPRQYRSRNWRRPTTTTNAEFPARNAET